MLTKLKLSVTLLFMFFALISCKDEEKYTPLKNTTTSPLKESNVRTNATFKSDLHTVIVKEKLKTDKYLYLKVIEKGVVDPFWIATRISDIIVGETYFYKGGLLKTNFESKEFKLVFDKIYLISSNLVLANHASNTGFQKKANTPAKTAEVKTTPSKITSTTKNVKVKGSIKISELVKNAKKYEGETVQISGICKKINAGIMNKNWIHLADGTLDEYDLVITSNELVKEGESVTIKAVVTLNKNFGAGYKYDLILEEGTIVH